MINARSGFVFIGRSGCGKGTQGKLLLEFLNKKQSRDDGVLYLETGDRFREFIKSDAYSNQLSRQVMVDALPQPSFLAVWMWAHILVEELTADHQTLILDGTPRSLIEAQALDTAFKFYGFTELFVIHLDVSREWSRSHLLKRGRKDDNLPDIDKRLDWYETDVVPALDFYINDPKYQYLKLNGEESMDEIHSAIIARL